MRLARVPACTLLPVLVVLSAACGGEPRSYPAGPLAFEKVFSLEQELRLKDDPDAPLGMPIALTRWRGNFVVVDQMLGNVKVFDDAGRLVSTIGRRGEGPGELGSPLDAAELEDGSLAVLDYGNGRVSIFDADGDLLDEWSTPAGRFRSMEVAQEDRIVLGGYLADEVGSPNARAVHIFSTDGQLERSLRPRSTEWRFGERTFARVVMATTGTVLCSFEAGSNRAHFVDLATGREWGATIGSKVYVPVDWSDPGERGQSLQAATAWYNEQMWVNRVVPVDPSTVLVRFTSVDPDSGERRAVFVLANHDGSPGATIETSIDNDISYADEEGLFDIHVDNVGQTWLRMYKMR